MPPFYYRWQPLPDFAKPQIVLIGQDMDEADLRARLDACLLSDAEFARGPAGWAAFDDPFGDWSFPTDDDEDEDQQD